MTNFDPALVRFERIGDPNGALGTTLVLHYGDALIFESAATLGIRRKFLLPEAGVILKVEAVPTSTPDTWLSQAETEWRVYITLPPELAPHFQRLLFYRHDVIEAPQPGGRLAFTDVHWVAQELVDGGRTGCPYLEFKDRWIAAEAAGFTPHDHKPDQLYTKADGAIVWLDWGGWESPTTLNR